MDAAPAGDSVAGDKRLALGDALAMVLLKSRGLTREDFAKYHPAGTLGMTLLLGATAAGGGASSFCVPE